MNVLILAGGFGTRLYPLTKNLPKALVNVNNKPIIEYILEKVKCLEQLETIFIFSNNKFYVNFLEWLANLKERDHIAEKIKIINSGINNESEQVGAIFDLKNALSYIPEESLLLLASDNLFEYDLNRLVDLADKMKTTTIALKNIYNPELIKKYSCVILDDFGKITFFEEKPLMPVSKTAALACYCIHKDDVKKIKLHSFERKDNLGNIISLLHRESQVYGVIFEEFWADIGSFNELELAEKHFH